MDHPASSAPFGYSTVDDPSSRFYALSKQLVFRLSKWTGLFALASRKTGHLLRILCYHGFSIEDEDGFRPRLFMRPSTFRQRLEYLSRKPFPILSLDEALDRLTDGTLPPRATVITVDDGFVSFYWHALPLLSKFSFPATLYVATSDFLRGQPIFRLVVQYMFWKTRVNSLRLDDFFQATKDQPASVLRRDFARVMWNLVQYGDSLETDAQRTALIVELGRRLELDYQAIRSKRLFCLMNSDELSDLPKYNIDVQLHTHNHRFPDDPDLAQAEIQKNIAVLAPYASKPLRHFCYPSGIWSEKQWPILAGAGIRSAMTCEPGLNSSLTRPFAMTRFLDGEDVRQVEFEAEMQGYSELLRRTRGSLRRISTSL
jgi:peptidoglycan/xylan/chitin deacetylase (PgdA/CDA1 family)